LKNYRKDLNEKGPYQVGGDITIHHKEVQLQDMKKESAHIDLTGVDLTNYKHV